MALEGDAPNIFLENVTLDLPARNINVSTAIRTDGRVGGRFVFRGKRIRKVRLLEDVSLVVEPGMSMGVVGLNGSGKSSLLRLLAGIYSPTSGIRRVQGKVTTLFSNQLGMNQNATGAENIKLMALLLGLDDRSLDSLIEDVTEFSELGEYINFPIRTYSAGMKTRIGFGVATAGSPEVLLVDEVFGTGDQSFVAKARQRMKQLVDRSGVVILASHSPVLLKEYCTHLIWLDRGRVMAFGEFESVMEEYRVARGG